MSALLNGKTFRASLKTAKSVKAFGLWVYNKFKNNKKQLKTIKNKNFSEEKYELQRD